jgi:hypothetical protein
VYFAQQYTASRVLAAALIYVALSVPAGADELSKGLDAYRAGRYTLAWQMLKPLALSGNGDAQNQIGLMYANGQGIARDDSSAAYWFQRAAEFGNARAQRNLDFLIANGRAKTTVPEEPECR